MRGPNHLVQSLPNWIAASPAGERDQYDRDERREDDQPSHRFHPAFSRVTAPRERIDRVNGVGRVGRKVRLVSVALLVTLFALPVAAAQKPSLVIVISVDQMRADYLERFRPWFSKDGFNRFLERGAVFTQARHRHSYTETAPGHASIGTGLDPRHHGVLSNRLFDPVSKSNPYVVSDPFVQWVGMPRDSPEIPASPVRLDSASLGDRLKERFPRARVVGIALKDRAAVFMAGRKADAAVWFDEKSGRAVTSTYYPPRPSLLVFNEGRLQKFLADPSHAQWRLSEFLPAAELEKLTFDPPELSRYKDSIEDMGEEFPHKIKNSRALFYSPFGNDLLAEYFRFAVRDFALGRNPSRAPDLLFVGFSSTDLYGHKYGPDSKEVADGIVRLDRTLADLFRWLDAWLGGRSSIVFLTSDHGMTPIPEVAREKARRAGQDVTDDFGRCDLHNPRGKKTVGEAGTDRLEVERALARELHYPLDENKPNVDEGAIAWFEDGFLYLNRPVLARRRLDLERVKEAVRDALKSRAGVSAVYTNTQIGNGLPPGSPAAAAVERSFRADRAGEVYAILRPGWIWFYERSVGTTHGQPNEDDVHVPLLAWGASVAAGRYDVSVSPLSIAKTIGRLFGFEVGEPDVEALEAVIGREREDRKLPKAAAPR